MFDDNTRAHLDEQAAGLSFYVNFFLGVILVALGLFGFAFAVLVRMSWSGVWVPGNRFSGPWICLLLIIAGLGCIRHAFRQYAASRNR